jgi:hypothetical protein
MHAVEVKACVFSFQASTWSHDVRQRRSINFVVFRLFCSDHSRDPSRMTMSASLFCPLYPQVFKRLLDLRQELSQQATKLLLEHVVRI